MEISITKNLPSEFKFLSYDSDEDELLPTDTSDSKFYEVLITLQKEVHTTSGSYTNISFYAFSIMELLIQNV